MREKFREFVTEHSDLTQKQMAQLWGHDATQQNISYAKTDEKKAEKQIKLSG